MKRIFLSSFLFLLALMAAMTSLSCRDKNSGSYPGSSSGAEFRVTGISSYKDDMLQWKEAIEYAGDKISMRHYFTPDSLSGQMKESFRDRIDYPNDFTAIILRESSSPGTWETQSRDILTFSGSILTGKVNYRNNNGVWEENSRFDRILSGRKIMQTISYDFVSGGFVAAYREDYQYSGTKIIQSMTYHYNSGWYQSSKTVVAYKGNLADSITDYAFNSSSFIYHSKGVFEYSNGLVSKITFFDYQNGTWVGGSTFTFSYDSDVNLVEEIRKYNGAEYRTVYTYETKIGNWRQIFDSEQAVGYLYRQLAPCPTMCRHDNPIKGYDPVIRRLAE